MYNFVDMYMYYLKHVECYCIRLVIMQLSSDIVDFDLFYDEPVDMQMCVFLTRSQCRVPDTQVTVKPCWPLVKNSQWVGGMQNYTRFFSYYSLHSSNVTSHGWHF